jgi:hypothetical protein
MLQCSGVAPLCAGDEDVPGDVKISFDFFNQSAGFGLRPLPESPSSHLVGSRRRGAMHFRGQRSGDSGGDAIWVGRASGCGFVV